MKLDRLMGILTVLLQTERATAPELARRFEVSTRTILRDVDALCRAGIPVETRQGEGGGIAIMQGYKINHSVLTAEELQNLTSALKGLDSVSQQSAFEGLMQKLVPGQAMVLPTDSVVIDLSSYYKDSLSPKIALFKDAIRQKQTVAFDYYSPQGETRREIDPYCIEFRWSAWYVFGWCHQRQDFRRFKLNRLWHPAVTGQSFILRSVPSDAAGARDAFPDTAALELWFDKSQRFRLIEEYGPGCYREEAGGLYVSLGYTNREYILSWLLGFGDKAELLAPIELREEFAHMTRRLAQKYEVHP